MGLAIRGTLVIPDGYKWGLQIQQVTHGQYKGEEALPKTPRPGWSPIQALWAIPGHPALGAPSDLSQEGKEHGD